MCLCNQRGKVSCVCIGFQVAFQGCYAVPIHDLNRDSFWATRMKIKRERWNVICRDEDFLLIRAVVLLTVATVLQHPSHLPIRLAGSLATTCALANQIYMTGDSGRRS